MTEKSNADNKEEKTTRGGFQPKKTDKLEAQNPPSGGSSMNTTKSKKDQK